jgi:P4 family phage/plasmid primase-like protien
MAGRRLRAVADGPSGASFFDDHGSLIVPALGDVIGERGPVALGHDGLLYRYSEGVYRRDGEAFVRVQVRELLAQRFKRRHTDEILAYLRAQYPTVGDAQPAEFVNVRNGLLRWEEGLLVEHGPDVISTCQLPVRWDPAARCPLNLGFLKDVIPGDAVEFVFEIIGYAIYSGNPFRVAILLLGPGRNGKSVLLSVIRALLGAPNVSAVPLQVLSENRFAAAELFGKLANICGDLDARAVRSTDTFKMLVGGDPILAERKHRDHFHFVAHALPLFSANEPPLSSDQTQAWFDRWLVVPMERRIAEEQVDPHLVRRLTTPEELEGLLVRAVEGLRRLMLRGRFAPPPSVSEAGAAYRDRLDSVRGFVAEECVVVIGAWTPRPALYRAYRRWATEGGRLPVSAPTFVEHLRRAFGERVQETKRRGTWGWSGIGLQQPGGEPEPRPW